MKLSAELPLISIGIAGTGIFIFFILLILVIIYFVKSNRLSNKPSNKCIAPTNTSGYNVTETETDFNRFDVTAVCQSGYQEDDAKAIKCSTPGEQYSLTGCTEVTCTQPSTVGYDFSSVQETSLNGSSFDVTGITCATNYKQDPSAEGISANVCTADGDYNVIGCISVTDCEDPDTPGYNYSGQTGAVTHGSFAVTGITCATGYSGSAAAADCAAAGQPYTVTGCKLKPGYFVEAGVVKICTNIENVETVTCTSSTNSVPVTAKTGYYIVPALLRNPPESTCTAIRSVDQNACNNVKNLDNNQECNEVAAAGQGDHATCIYNTAGSIAEARPASVNVCTAIQHATNVACTDSTDSVPVTAKPGYYIVPQSEPDPDTATCTGYNSFLGNDCDIHDDWINGEKSAQNCRVGEGCTYTDIGPVTPASIGTCDTVYNAETVRCTSSGNSIPITANSGFYILDGVAAVPSLATCIGTNRDTGEICADTEFNSGDGSVSTCKVDLDCKYTGIGEIKKGSIASVHANATCNAKTIGGGAVTDEECATQGGYFATFESNAVCEDRECDMAVENDKAACCTPCTTIPNALSVSCTDSTYSVPVTAKPGYYIDSTSSVQVCDTIQDKYGNSAGVETVTCSGANNSIPATVKPGYYITTQANSGILAGAVKTCSSVPNAETVVCTGPTVSVPVTGKLGYYVENDLVKTCAAITNAATVMCTDPSNSVPVTAEPGFYVEAGVVKTCDTVPNAATVMCTDPSNSVPVTGKPGYYVAPAVPPVPVAATCAETETTNSVSVDFNACAAVTGATLSNNVECDAVQLDGQAPLGGSSSACTYTAIGSTTSASPATVQLCDSDTDADAGCGPLCRQPIDITGFVPTENNISTDAFDVSATCATGYEGTAVVTACHSSLYPYTLSGCAPIVCTTPAETTGYTVTNTELNVATGFAATVGCADGYESTGDGPTATTCGDVSGPYSLSGCAIIGVTSDNHNWLLQTSVNQSCTETCATVGHTCESGDWGVHSEAAMIDALGLAKETHATVCSAGFSGKSSILAPYADANSDCKYSEQYVYQGAAVVGSRDSSCDATDWSPSPKSRLCKCVKPWFSPSAVVCTQPTDITGYDTPTEINLDSTTGLPFDVNVTCATGYEGTAVATACSADGPYTLSGCAPIVCTTPVATTGYTVTNTELNVATGFAATVGCADGYESTGDGPAATTCGDASGPYSLSGCAIMGVTSENHNWFLQSSTNQSCTDTCASRAGHTCEDGDWGVHSEATMIDALVDANEPHATVCSVGFSGNSQTWAPATSDGVCKYPDPNNVVQQCDAEPAVAENNRLCKCVKPPEVVCTQPTDITGYTPTETNLDSTAGLPFDVTVTCANGWEGTATATNCAADGPYTLSGCAPIVCTTPAATTGYSVTAETILDLSAGVFDVSASCTTGYEGSPDVTACTTSGPYSLTGCNQIVCTKPTDTTGYTVTTENNLSAGTAFDVTATCANGYEGSPVVTACTTSGPYSLTGCQQIMCTEPPDITGYRVDPHQLNVYTGFHVDVGCAAGYQSTGAGPAATTCGDASGPYSLSGCAIIGEITSDNYEWILQTSANPSCTETCATVGHRCEEGDWGVHSAADMTDALESAGEIFDRPPSNVCSVGFGGNSQTWAPATDSNGGCRYPDPSTVVQLCDTPNLPAGQNRLCKCVKQ